MRFSDALCLRRIFFSNYHPFQKPPKASKWPFRERLKRFNAWQYGTYRIGVKAGYTQLHKTFIYMDMQRKDRPKLELYYAEERLNSALKEHHTNLFRFQEMLHKAHILLNTQVLSQLAIYEPRTLKSLVDLTEKMALEEGHPTYATELELEHVEIDSRLFDEPFPEAKIYPKGPEQHHKIKPRQLKLEEY